MNSIGKASVSLSLFAALLGGCGEYDSSFVGAAPSNDEVTRSSALSNTASKSLLIIAPWVTANPDRTEDPCSTTPGDENKVWTLGHMLKREAEKNGINPQTYVNNWITAWNTTVTINGQTVPPLEGLNVRTSWQRYSGSSALPLHKAPFVLRAIVSRLDLRKHRPAGEPLGGEVRFVFGFYAPEPNPTCPTAGMSAVSTIILEYSPAKTNENQVRDFGRRWLDLENLSGDAYLSDLQVLTEEVINGGRLLRIRTNEFPPQEAEPAGWNLLEFEPNPTTRFLQRSTVKQSPSMALANGTSALLGNWIWNNRNALLANAFDLEATFTSPPDPIGSYVVPNTFPGTTTTFRGSINTTGLDPNDDFWTAPAPGSADAATYAQARARFSIGTCRGCHGRESGTSFLHIFPGTLGEEPGLSQFLLRPLQVEDPVVPGLFRTFSEMTRRENDLRMLVNQDAVRVPVLGNNYTLRFLDTVGRCLDSAGNTTTDGAFSQLFDCHGNANQRLSLVSVGNQVFSLRYKHSGKCIDIQNGSTSNGARVVQMTCNSTRTSQRMTLSSSDTPLSRRLRFQHSNLCLLVQNQGQANGTPIVQGTCPAPNDSNHAVQFVE